MNEREKEEGKETVLLLSTCLIHGRGVLSHGRGVWSHGTETKQRCDAVITKIGSN